MVEQGRTMHDAIEAGTFFEFARGTFSYAPPACETPAEVAACLLARCPRLRGETFEVVRIIGGTIGGRIVEAVGAWTLGVTTELR